MIGGEGMCEGVLGEVWRVLGEEGMCEGVLGEV